MHVDESFLRSEVNRIVDLVFQTMLQGRPAPLGPPPPRLERPFLSASVSFMGAVNGLVCLTVEESLAHRLTRELMGLGNLDLPAAEDDINDAMGEVANMITGNLKSSLAEPGTTSRLSLPAICRGRALAVSSSSHSRRFAHSFFFQDHPVLVDVFLADA